MKKQNFNSPGYLLPVPVGRIGLGIFGIVLAMAIVFSGCRYEKGPAISFKKPEKRLMGYYEMESFSINGNDFSDDYRNHCNFRMWIRESSSVYQILFYDAAYPWESGQGFGLVQGNTGFTNDSKKSLYMLFPASPSAAGYELFRYGIQSEWRIQKLSDKNFWLESSTNTYDPSKVYYMKLKKLGENPAN